MMWAELTPEPLTLHVDAPTIEFRPWVWDGDLHSSVSCQQYFCMSQEGVKASFEPCKGHVTPCTETGLGRGVPMHCEDKSCGTTGRRQWSPLRKYDITDQPVHGHHVRKQ